MPPTLSLVVLLLAACDSGPNRPEGSDLSLTVAVGDTTRTARVRVPDALSSGAPAHLLIALHGSQDSGPNFQRGSRIDEVGTDDLIIAYPTAAKGNWAEGCDCNVADRLQIDDLGFMGALIDSIGARYNVAPERTYAMGYSQGGLFAYRLACHMGDAFAAVAAVSAPMSVPLSHNCNPGEATSVLTLHGALDRVLPWGGTSAGSLSLLSAPNTAGFWAEEFDCAPSRQETLRSGDATLRAVQWESCRDGVRVSLYEMPDGAHTWYTKSPDSRRLFLEFFGL